MGIKSKVNYLFRHLCLYFLCICNTFRFFSRGSFNNEQQLYDLFHRIKFCLKDCIILASPKISSISQSSSLSSSQTSSSLFYCEFHSLPSDESIKLELQKTRRHWASLFYVWLEWKPYFFQEEYHWLADYTYKTDPNCITCSTIQSNNNNHNHNHNHNINFSTSSSFSSTLLLFQCPQTSSSTTRTKNTSMELLMNEQTRHPIEENVYEDTTNQISEGETTQEIIEPNNNSQSYFSNHNQNHNHNHNNNHQQSIHFRHISQLDNQHQFIEKNDESKENTNQ